MYVLRFLILYQLDDVSSESSLAREREESAKAAMHKALVRLSRWFIPYHKHTYIRTWYSDLFFYYCNDFSQAHQTALRTEIEQLKAGIGKIHTQHIVHTYIRTYNTYLHTSSSGSADDWRAGQRICEKQFQAQQRSHHQVFFAHIHTYIYTHTYRHIWS